MNTGISKGSRWQPATTRRGYCLSRSPGGLKPAIQLASRNTDLKHAVSRGNLQPAGIGIPG